MDWLNEILNYELFKIDLTPEDDTGAKSVTVFQVLIIIIILIGSRIALWSLRKVFDRIDRYRRIPMESGRRKAVFQIIQYIVYIITFIFILNSLNFEVKQFIALSAALLVGLGFGLQNIFNDIISGILILIDGTIEVDDVVEVDSLSLMGQVKSIRLRTSIIETPDAITVIVPNSKFTSTNVINWSHDEKATRFHISVGVAYGSNVSLVRDILKDVASKHGNILMSPEPKIFFTDFGDSALMFELLFWTEKSFTIEELKSDLRYMIEAEFRRNNIRIPFPQRDLHIVEDYRFEQNSKKDSQSSNAKK